MGILCCPGQASIRDSCKLCCHMGGQEMIWPQIFGSVPTIVRGSLYYLTAQDPPKDTGRVLEMSWRRSGSLRSLWTEIVNLSCEHERCEFPTCIYDSQESYSHVAHAAFSNSLKSFVWILLSFFCGSPMFYSFCVLPQSQTCLMFHLLSVGIWVSLDFSSLICSVTSVSDGSSKSYHLMVYHMCCCCWVWTFILFSFLPTRILLCVLRTF